MKAFFRLPISKRLFCLAIFLRLLVMPFFFQPDIKTFNFQSSFLHHGVFNIYDYLINNKDSLPLKEEFVYFPLAYFFLGGYQAVASPVLGTGFDKWLFDASGSSLDAVGVYRYLFVLKLPYLFFDLLIGYLLIRFVKRKKNKKKVFTFWFFNPFTVFLIYFYSNIDVIPVFLSLLALLLFKKGKSFVSALALGLAFCFKAYPMIMIPFLFVSSKSVREKTEMLLGFLLPVALFILPLWSKGFLASAFSSGLTTRIFSTGIPLGFGESMMIVIFSLSLLFYCSLKKIKRNDIWIYFMSSLLLILSFIHFHIQWILWVLPFLILVEVLRPGLTLPVNVFLVCAFLVVWFYFDKSMTIGLLSPISRILTYSTPPSSIAQKIIDPYVLQGIFHSILAGSSVYLIFSLLNIKRA